MRYFFVANTLHRHHEQNLRRCIDYLKAKKHEVALQYTRYAGHAEILAREAAREGWDVIVGAGGDGTLHEVLNGMIGSSSLLALFPMGTGNVFAREMRLPRHWKAIASMLEQCETVWLDTGKVDNTHFLLMLSAGFDAYAIQMLSSLEGENRKRGLRTVFGKFAYVFGGIQALGRYTFPPITVFVNNERFTASFVLISNIQRYGRYFKITPAASPIDGKLDLFLYQEMGRWNLIRLVLGVISSLWHPYETRTMFTQSRSLTCTEVTLTSTEPVLSQLDGELFKPLPLHITISPHSVQMVLPSSIIKKYQTLPQ